MKRSFCKISQPSYLSGVSDNPLICDTIGGLLRKQAARVPSQMFQ